MASKLFARLIATSLLVWGVATAWAMTIEGVLEPARLDVDYYEMGAGDDLLVFRLKLALGLALLAVLWTFVKGTPGARLRRLAIAPCILVLFILSVVSLDRTAPGFSEAEFLRIVEAHLAGRAVSLRDVRRRLGQPLIVVKDRDSLVYSYTFTPSGGFGWHKRVLAFDSRGNLVDFLNMDEP